MAKKQKQLQECIEQILGHSIDMKYSVDEGSIENTNRNDSEDRKTEN